MNSESNSIESLAPILGLDAIQSDQLAQTLELASWESMREAPMPATSSIHSSDSDSSSRLNGSSLNSSSSSNLASQILTELDRPEADSLAGKGAATSFVVCMLSGLSFQIQDRIAHGLYRLKCHPLFAAENERQLARVLAARAPFEPSAEIQAGALLAIAIRHGLLIASEDPLKMREANRLTRHLGSTTISRFYQTILKDSHSERRPRFRIDGLWTGAARPIVSDIKRTFALISGLEYQTDSKPNQLGWEPFKAGGLRAQHTALTKIPKSKSFSMAVLTERVPPLLNRVIKAHHRELGLIGSAAGMARIKQLEFISSAATEHAIELRSLVAKVALIANNKQAWTAFEAESVKCYIGELDSLILNGPINVDF
jgi:hypothetical protein